jgi:hypothetical protein
VSGTQIVTAQQTTANGAQLDTTLTVQAVCPTGTTLISGGGNVTNSDNTPHPARVQLVESRPINSTTWQVTGVVGTGLGSSNAMTVFAYAYCTA